MLRKNNKVYCRFDHGTARVSENFLATTGICEKVCKGHLKFHPGKTRQNEKMTTLRSEILHNLVTVRQLQSFSFDRLARRLMNELINDFMHTSRTVTNGSIENRRPNYGGVVPDKPADNYSWEC